MKKLIKKINNYNIFLSTAISTLLIVLVFACILKKDRVFSDIERRNLKTFNAANINIFDDDFCMNIENVIVDQFVFRDSFIKLKSGIDVLCMKNHANGVYILNDRYIEEQAKVDYDVIAKKTHYMINEMKSVKANVVFALFPNACSVDNDKIKWMGLYDYQNDVMDLLTDVYKNSNIKLLDMRDALHGIKNQDRNIYYKTDHHINSDAMYIIKDDILDSLSIEDNHEYDRVKLCDNFQGSLVSKSCVFKNKYDSIYAYIDKRPTRYTVYDYGEQKEKSSIYDFDKLDSYDPYLVFMGDNSKLINIKTENYDKKRLLLIKDSYANCFIPYLLPYYSNIDIVDPRYVSDINTLVSYEDYDDILYFYNMNTYMEK